MGDDDAVSRESERLLQHFITVGIGETICSFEGAKDQPPFDIFRPITSIIICTGPNPPPTGYEIVRFTVSGASASLRQGYFGPQVWLAVSRDPSYGSPITEIVVIKEDEKPTGFFKVEYNFQKLLRRGGEMFGRSASPAFIYFERDPMKVPILEVIFINESEKDTPPPDFWKVQNNAAQSGIRFGSGLDLYYKKCAATPLDQFYKPNVIDMYPKKGSFLPVTVAQFCQPSGAMLMRIAPLPVSHDFVLTNAIGRRMYGSALTCFELLSNDVWAKSLDAILQKFPRMTINSDVIVAESPITGRTLPPRSVTAECQSPEHIARGLSLSFESKPIFASKTLCLLSYYPFFDQFRSMLAELYRISVSPRSIPLEHVLVNMFEIPVPLSPNVASQMRIGSKTVLFRIPSGEDDFPLLDCSFQLLFRTLSLNCILTIFTALILERKVILVSSHARLLTPIAQSLLSLLFPLEWQYSYVPVLPRVCSGILDAPMPVFVGLRQPYVDPRLYERSDTVVVDLDSGRIQIASGDASLLPLPSVLAAILRSELEEYGRLSTVTKLSKEELDGLDLTFPMIPTDDHRRSQSMLIDQFNERAVRAAFIHFFAALFGNFREYLLFPEIPSNIRLDELFEKKKFLEEKTKGSLRNFSAALLETQSFTRFIEERTFPSDRDSELKFFDRCCDYHRSVESIADKTESVAGLVQSLLASSEIKFLYKVPPPPLSPSQNLPSYVSFPILDESNLYNPRPIAVENFKKCGDGKENLDSGFKQAFFQSKPMINSLFLHRRSMERLSSSFQSSIEWARHLLMLVYSSWFLLQSLSVDWDPSLTSSIVDVVFDVLQQAQKLELHPDESTYRSVLKLCAKFSRAEAARTILQQMKDCGIQPTQVTYALFTAAVTEAPISPHTRQSVEDFKRPLTSGTAASFFDYLSIPSKVSASENIDWSQVYMSSVSICIGCNSRLSDSEIMTGWGEDPEIETSRCIVCQSISFQPELNIRLTYANQRKESLSVNYLSPLVLRTILERAVATEAKDQFSPKSFRTGYPVLFYNLLWYFYHEKLSLVAMVGKENVVIKRIVPRHRRDSLLNDGTASKSSGSPPKNHHHSRNALIRYLERNDVLNAMRLFLLHRIKEANVGGSGGVLDKASVWSHSMFREMDALGAQWFFPSRADWIQSYGNALGNVPKHMQNYLLPVDNAPSSVTSIFEDVFRHDEASSSHDLIPSAMSPTKSSSTSEISDLKPNISTKPESFEQQL